MNKGNEMKLGKLSVMLMLSAVLGLSACGGEQKANNQAAPVGLMSSASGVSTGETSAAEPSEKPKKVKKATENIAPSEPVDINTATAEELVTALKGTGVGKAKVEKIIEYRTQHGGFKSIDELTEVKGIGDKTMEKLRSRVIVSAAKSAPTGKEKSEDKDKDEE